MASGYVGNSNNNNNNNIVVLITTFVINVIINVFNFII